MSKQLTAQVILNGDFENTLATTCVENPTPQVFDSLMPYLHFHTPYIIGIDIMTTGCPFVSCPTPPHGGNWCVAVGTYNMHHEMLAMQLSQPLTIGNVYRLDYWFYPDDFWASSNVDSMHIGITTDITKQGTIIQRVIAPPDVWSHQIIQFTANTAATHITVAPIDWLVGNAWYFVDDFVLTNLTTSVSQIASNTDIKLYPNPVKTTVTLEIEEGMEEVDIAVFDLQGRVIKETYRAFLKQETFDFSDLESGIYLIRLTSATKTEILKIVKE